MLSSEEKIWLLNLARKSIQNYFGPNEFLKLNSDEISSTIQKFPKIGERRGCFVTLKTHDDQLRGCIGIISSPRPLYENVIQYAVHSAIHDQRFQAVTLDELKTITIEISVLSPIWPVTNLEDIHIGQHGLIVNYKGQQGLLLPQVATQWKMDREKFLEQTCIKAGLDKDMYKNPETEIYYFTAEVISEKEAAGPYSKTAN